MIAEVVVPELEATAAVIAEAGIAVLMIPVAAVVVTLNDGDHFDDWTVMCAIEAPQIDDAFLFAESPE